MPLTRSYNNAPPVPEDYAKEPPIMPPHLQLTLLNVPPAMDAQASTLGVLPAGCAERLGAALYLCNVHAIVWSSKRQGAVLCMCA